MTSPIDRAFIRAFTKQRDETPAKPHQTAPEAAPLPEAALPEASTLPASSASASSASSEPADALAGAAAAPIHRIDVRSTPAPSALTWQESPVMVSAIDGAFSPAASDVHVAEFPYEQLMAAAPSIPAADSGDEIDDQVNDGSDDGSDDEIGIEKPLVTVMRPEQVVRRLDEAAAVPEPHMKTSRDADLGVDADVGVQQEQRDDDAQAEVDHVSEPNGVAPGNERAEARLDTYAASAKSGMTESAEVAEPKSKPAARVHINGAFVPAWETDRIDWPRMADRLMSLDDRFETAGRQLAEATASGLRVLAVTSTYRGEGRTTIAMNLARSAASHQIRVAIVDGDVDNPAMASWGGVAAVHGWHECLSGGLPLDEAAVASLEDGLTMLPLTSAVRRAPVTASGPAFESMLEALGQHFDLIVVDYGPLGASEEEHQSLAGDAAMLIRDIRCTSADQTLASVRKVRELGVTSVGVIQNFT